MFSPAAGARVVPFVQPTNGVVVAGQLSTDATPVPYVQITFVVSESYTQSGSPTTYAGGADSYLIYRNGTLISTVPQPAISSPAGVTVVGPSSLIVNDFAVTGGVSYAYSVISVWGHDNVHGVASPYVTAIAPLEPDTPIPPDPPAAPQGVVRWKFIDVFHKGPAPYEWQFTINPDAGGTPIATKNIAISYSSGPRVFGIVMEGGWGVPIMNFSGIILEQVHLETLEAWFEQRILIELHDDLGRIMRGVFSKFAPTRVRRATRAFYHTFEAEFTVIGYRNASGVDRYVRLVQPGTSR